MKTIIGTYLIDAPFSALNNRGIDKSATNENEVATKVIYSPEGTRPYVSAQALRYWWRTVLENKFGWNCSPVEVIGKNQAVTKANPLNYDDDDVFGYMSARKEATGENDKKGKPKLKNVTVTRVSPLKCSPLIFNINSKILSLAFNNISCPKSGNINIFLSDFMALYAAN